MFELFKKKSQKQSEKRKFKAVLPNRINNIMKSRKRIDEQLKYDGKQLILLVRQLAKNNSTVASYIDLMVRNVLGENGFKLNSTCTNEDGKSDTIANDFIQKNWQEYINNKCYVCGDENTTGRELDRLILFTLLLEGQVFIRKIIDRNSKHIIKFEVIDNLDIDFDFNTKWNGEYQISMGVKLDRYNKPISYFIKDKSSATYNGQRTEIEAKEIIHIYRKNFCKQTRGYSPLSSVILNLDSLDQFKKYELDSALLQACYMGVFEKVGNNTFDMEEEEQINNGDIASCLQQGVFKFAPQGYTLKSIQSNHPNSNFGSFCKAISKQIASALGVSSNKLQSDYESVNYSSLRQANQEDIATWKELQRFVIQSWKDLQFQEWLKYFLLYGNTNLPYSKIEKFRCHEWICKGWQYLDPVKEYSAIKLKMQMKITNPIIEIQKAGLQVEDVLNGWQNWKKMLEDRGLTNDEKIDEITDEILKHEILKQNQQE